MKSKEAMYVLKRSRQGAFVRANPIDPADDSYSHCDAWEAIYTLVRGDMDRLRDLLSELGGVRVEVDDDESYELQWEKL
jgi:phage/plasmid-associated DNA primase